MASWKKIINEDTSGVASISSKLGVGLSSPVTSLHVHAATTGSNFVHVTNNTSGGGANDGMEFGLNGAHGYVWNRENASLYFGTNDTTRMTISSTGNTGLGTSSPSQLLHVEGSSFPTALIKGGSSGAILKLQGANNDYISFNDNSSDRWYLRYQPGQDKFDFYNANSSASALTILDSTNNIGVGTDSPTQRLDIQSNNSAGTIVQIRDTGDDYPVGVTYNHAISGHHYAWYSGTMDGTSGERKFTIGTKVVNGFHNDLTTSSYSLMELNQDGSTAQFRGGKVWIGNTHNNGQTWASMGNNGNELILDGGANSGMTIVTDNDEAGYINHNNYNNGNYQHIKFDSANAGMFFKAGGTDNVLALKAAGVGVGVASPTYKLDVSTGMRINRSSNDPYILLHRDGSGVAQIRGVSGGGINLTAASSSTSRLYINSSGDIGINHTSPSAMLDVAGSLKIQGNATFDQQVTHEDMVTFNSDVSFTNASLEGLSVSTSKILVLQSSAASSGQDVNDSTRDIYWASMSTENNTYVSWAAGSDGYFISFAQAGEYMVYVDLIVTDATANDRMNFFGWISHMTAQESTYYSYPLGGTYIRDDSSLYDSGGIGGSARLIVAANDKVKVNTQRFDSQDSLDDNPLSTSLSRIRIEKINYNLNTG